LPVLLIILTARKIMSTRIEMGPVCLWDIRGKLALSTCWAVVSV